MRIFNIIKGVASRLALVFIWVIILGIVTSEFNTPVGLALGLLVTISFIYFHCILKIPKEWDFGRIKLKKPPYFAFLILVSFVILFGDIFWIFHIKTSADTFDEDTLLFIILGIIAFPLIEEFGFRLWLQSYLESVMNQFIAIFVVALLFSMVHSADMPIPQLLSGLLYGIALVVTKSIWVPVGLHVIHNAILILSGQIEIIKTISFNQMDRLDNLNLYIAITLWVVATTSLVYWTWLAYKLKDDGGPSLT